jgi:hypothetical protein
MWRSCMPGSVPPRNLKREFIWNTCVPACSRLVGAYRHSFLTKKSVMIFWESTVIREPGYRSRYNDWLRAGCLRGRSSSPGRVKNFLFFTSFRPALGPILPPIQWVPGALSSGIRRPGCEADHWPPTSAEVKKNVDLYIYSPILLHDIVLN